MPIEGLQELVNKLEKLTDDKVVVQVQKKALKPLSQEILTEVKKVTPVSKERNIHGIDAENVFTFSRNNYKGYDIGITNQGGHGEAYWDQIRGKHICHVTALIR